MRGTPKKFNPSFFPHVEQADHNERFLQWQVELAFAHGHQVLDVAPLVWIQVRATTKHLDRDRFPPV